MSSGGQKKTRLERVAALEMPPNMVERLLGDLQRGDVLLRIGLCFLSAVFLWGVVGAWAPPFAIRRGFVPDRDILARVEFKKKDDVATQTARERAANQVRFIYEQDPSSLVQLRSALKNKLAEINNAASFLAVNPAVWKDFSAPSTANVEPPTPEENEAAFQQFHDAISTKEKLDRVGAAIDSAFAPLEQHGLIDKLSQS
ncbi:MAG TPA: hypothetical protein VGI75_12710, partial [Pirellulales bacterium]